MRALLLFSAILALGACAPSAEGPAGDPAAPLPALTDRAAWHERLRWTEACERAHREDPGPRDPGIRAYPVGEGLHLVEVRCSRGAYQDGYNYVLHDLRADPESATLLRFPAFDGERWSWEAEAAGEPTFVPETAELELFGRARGIGDCGTLVRYGFPAGRPELRWVRARECSESGDGAAPPPGEWPLVSPPRGEVRIVVVSDLNGRYGSTVYEPEVHRTVRLVRELWRPELVLAAGDLIAGQKPSLTDAEVRAMWAAFDSVVAAPLREAGIPFGFTLGNHDGSAHPAHRRDRALAVEHWRAPAHDPGVAFVDRTHFPFYYSFLQGGVFVLVWDASFAGTVRELPMMEWVRRQLESAPAREARHRLVLGHLPLYAVAEGRNRRGEVLEEPDSLRRILERHGVDSYVSGHHHAYYPGRRGALELLHTGALGQGARPLLGSERTPEQTVTVLDFFLEADSVAYTTYAFDEGAEGGLRPVETAGLPPVLRGINGYVVRRDLPDGP